MGVNSELTLAETLIKPMMDKNLALEKLYKDTLQTSSNLDVSNNTSNSHPLR
jgi:hypothetical protein